jgi:hypothetical protein
MHPFTMFDLATLERRTRVDRACRGAWRIALERRALRIGRPHQRSVT